MCIRWGGKSLYTNVDNFFLNHCLRMLSETNTGNPGNHWAILDQTKRFGAFWTSNKNVLT